MKRFLLIPFVAVTLLQLAGIAAPPAPQKKKTSRAAPKKKPKKLPYKAKVPGVDPTVGDNVDGDDLVIRRAAVAALGTFAGSAVVVDPASGRILSMVDQTLALKTGFVPCSPIQLVTARAALTRRRGQQEHQHHHRPLRQLQPDPGAGPLQQPILQYPGHPPRLRPRSPLR